MPLKGLPKSITPECLYALARMGHGDQLVIADAFFPSDSIASQCIVKEVVRVSGKTSDILRDVLQLLPLDCYDPNPVAVMDRVQGDKDSGLLVEAYAALATAAGVGSEEDLHYIERFSFYEYAKKSFVVIQTDDCTKYANVIVRRGVV